MEPRPLSPDELAGFVGRLILENLTLSKEVEELRQKAQKPEERTE